MRISAVHSHLGGQEWMLVHEPSLWPEIVNIVEGVSVEGLGMPSGQGHAHQPTEPRQTWTVLGRRLRWTFADRFAARGWTTVPPLGDCPDLVSRKRHQARAVEFFKNLVAVEVQFGKYSFIAYDLFVKHLAFYVGNVINVGVEILPMKSMQEHMSSGPGYYEGALYDIARQGRGVPAVPLVLVGVEP